VWYSHIIHGRYLTDLFSPEIVVKDYFSLLSLLFVGIRSIESALLRDSQDIKTWNFTDIIDFAFVLALYFSLWNLFLKVPNVNGSCFVTCDPGLKILQVPNVRLILWTTGCSGYDFLELKVIGEVPKTQSKVFQYSSNSFLPLTISEGQKNDILFDFRVLRSELFQ
jgi:hypothetical protein